MQHFLRQLKKLRDTTVLDRSKKDAVRQELVNYMRAMSAVREQELERHNIMKRSVIFTNKYKKSMQFAAIVAILALLGGGTSVAAEGALPGDALYPVKVNINEKAAAALAFSAEGRAEVATRLAEKRLEEANALAAEGRLDAEAEAELEGSFEAASERAKERIEELRASGNASAAAEVGARFESALSAHSRALAAIRMHADDEDKQERIERVVMRVETALNAAAEARAEAQGEVTAGSAPDVEAAAEGKIGAAANVIAAVQARFDRVKDDLDENAVARIEAELENATELEAEARAEAAAGNYAEAFVLAGQAARAAHEVGLLLNLQIRIEASANAAVNVFGGSDNADNDTDDEENDEEDENDEVNAGAGNRTNADVNIPAVRIPVNVGL